MIDNQLASCIGFWGNILYHDKPLLSPTVLYFLEKTIKYLKELQEIKERETKDEPKKSSYKSS